MTPFESRTTKIATAPAELFQYLTSIDTIAQWYDGWDEVRHDGKSGFLAVGARFTLQTRRTARSAICRVVEVAAPVRLSWNEYSMEGTALRVSFDLALAEDGTTHLTLSKRVIAAH